jgi:hypothetical protein
MRIIYILSFFIFLISSCDCGDSMQGKVVDNSTGKPIKGVLVNFSNGKNTALTDEKGFFSVGYLVGGNCKPKIIELSKYGYKPFQLTVEYSKENVTYKVKKEDVFTEKPQNGIYNGNSIIQKWSQNFSIGDTIVFYLTKQNEQ